LTPDNAETLLDHHSTSIDIWLRKQLQRWELTLNPCFSYFLTGVTLLDQCVLEEFNWRSFLGIIQIVGTPMSYYTSDHSTTWLVDLFDRKESHTTFARMFSQFLMDQARAGPLWVNSQGYMNLAQQILKILCHK